MLGSVGKVLKFKFSKPLSHPDTFGISISVRKIVLFSELELHGDDTLSLDGVSVRDSKLDGEGGLACYIPAEHVEEFLDSCLAIRKNLKKRGLLLVKKEN